MTSSETSDLSRSARASSRVRCMNMKRVFGSAGQRVGQRVFLRLLEDDRVVDDGRGLLGDAIEQPAVVVGVDRRRRCDRRRSCR